MAAARSGVILLGGVNMTPRHLAKISATLYPALAAAARVRAAPHSVLQLVNVRHSFPHREAELRRSLDAFPDGCVVHCVSGSAFFATAALARWRDPRVRGVIMDSVPQLRLEAPLMRLVGVPGALVGPASALARALLVSPLFDATLAYTDTYSELCAQAGTYGQRVLFAHSEDDDVVPVTQFRDFYARVAAAKAAGAQGWGGTALDVYVGRGKHAAMARDDAGFAAKVQGFMGECGFAPEECGAAAAPQPA
jgi:hypothetical protein